jgi:hypothetical protein
MKKSEVYSWRVAPETKVALELEARRAGQSVAALLDGLTREWLNARRRRHTQDKTEQARLQAAAAKVLGTIAGGDPRRAERARAALQKRLASRRGR